MAVSCVVWPCGCAVSCLVRLLVSSWQPLSIQVYTHPSVPHLPPGGHLGVTWVRRKQGVSDHWSVSHYTHTYTHMRTSIKDGGWSAKYNCHLLLQFHRVAMGFQARSRWFAGGLNAKESIGIVDGTSTTIHTTPLKPRTTSSDPHSTASHTSFPAAGQGEGGKC